MICEQCECVIIDDCYYDGMCLECYEEMMIAASERSADKALPQTPAQQVYDACGIKYQHTEVKP